MIQLDKIHCKFCGGLFQPSRKWQLFCCEQHRNEFHLVRRAEALELLAERAEREKEGRDESRG